MSNTASTHQDKLNVIRMWFREGTFGDSVAEVADALETLGMDAEYAMDLATEAFFTQHGA